MRLSEARVQQSFHTPVLAREALELLITRQDGVYVDATIGGGGHAEAVLQKLNADGILIGIDADADAISATQTRLAKYGSRVILVDDNFRNLKGILRDQKVREVRGVLFDLGVSSFQLDQPTKGFSFRADEPLDMRMNRLQTLNARIVVNEYEENKLADLFWKYGEEKFSRKIAKRIVQLRSQTKVETTGKLVGIIESVVGQRFLTKTLARVFQAIRIEVNDELENLRKALSDAIDVVEKGGRIVVISYHSLEDRIVKQILKEASATSIPSGNKLVPDRSVNPRLAILIKKPLLASPTEIASNPRARSAKLRAAEKL